MSRQAQRLDPNSADLTLLQDRQVAVLGFGPVGSGHALNLRDSGVDVRVGVPADSRAAARAEIEGILVVEAADAVRQADIVVLPADEALDVATVAPLLGALEPGDLVLVTGPELVRDGLTVPEGVDLVLLQGIGGAHRLRDEYLDGRGVPALVAVETDASGFAWPVLTAYSQAVGALRSGALVTSVTELAAATTYAESSVHEPVQALVREGFDALIVQGVSEEVAYLVTLHELRARVDTALVAGFGPTQVSDRQAAALPSRRAAAAVAHPIEAVGRRVRALMSWIR
ncbi:NAD(P)-binding domain-containing protein [Ornithinimicrobium ciconiae]|uniref:NAD(P)-binding domain-containing protein n=1 Tax=Ornithinimicrobium ciconiae TaxID=2594265 RepID=UPI0013FCF826|nr:NAD(P)-binding domain-containing protein [Ornithinimicrobium ciconiae]